MSDDIPKHKTWLERLSTVFNGEPKDREALIELLRDAVDRQLLTAELLAMIEGVMQVSEMQARDIMIPRMQMTVIKADSTLDDILPIISESGHSRFPVVGENRDKIIGILLAKDVLKYVFNDKAGNFDINNIIRPTAFVPESKRLDSLLRDFRRTRNHLAIVVDEYGGIAGLVTIEDVLEQIVGEIEDEFDLEEDQEFIRKHNDLNYTVNALTTIEEFNEYFSADLSDEDFDTIGGLVLHKLGHMPKRGETTKIGPYHFTVLNADSRRIRLLRMTINL
ncbi:MAG: magnesium/cobalt efflux protein [Gammaproteobacteria bacterium RIFCSPHIGHO2_12_FULL_35_23]|nr:MAG: magnesium/cobalt efflux protein [Gammaproteobacteria bacterium RIFCSPHIGHO2_12_FULL_35_23]